MLFVDDGDIVLVDRSPARGATITRTTGAEANPRWARHETRRHLHARQQPVPRAARRRRLDRAAHRRRREKARAARDRQPEVRQGRRAEADRAYAGRGGEEEEGGGEGEGARAAEVRARRAPVGRRPAARRPTARTSSSSSSSARRRRSGRTCRTTSPSRATPKTFPARTNVGDAQDKRTLVVMNLETGKIAGRGRRVRRQRPSVRRRQSAGARSAMGHARCRTTTASLAVARRARGRQQGSLARRGRSRDRQDARHRRAARRCVGAGSWAASARQRPSFGWLPDQKHLWFLSERDGWMHLYTVDASADASTPRQLTQGKWEIDAAALSPDKKKFYLTTTRSASRASGTSTRCRSTAARARS